MNEYRRLWLILLLVVPLFLVSGCTIFGPGQPPKNMTNQTNQTQTPTNFTCPDGTVVPDRSLCPVNWCPSSCDDGNPCTADRCGNDTGYECVHVTREPCCGNGICEPAESIETCLDDCGVCPDSCEDINPCTRESCNRSTGFRCVHEPINGDAIGCCGQVGFGGIHGYSNVRLGFGLEVPDGWSLDDQSLKDEGGTIFIGPISRPNCTLEVSEKNVYSNLAYGFSVNASGLVVKKSAPLDGILFSTSEGNVDFLYVTSVQTAVPNIAKYVEQIRPRLLSARDTGAEVSLLGARLMNITVSEGRGSLAGNETREFIVSGYSNRTGTWANETERHVYLLRDGRAYDIALVATAETYEKMDQFVFENVLSSFKPTATFECPKEGYSPKIVVYSFPAEPTYMLDDYVSEWLALFAMDNDYVLISTDNTTLAGNNAKTYSVSFADNGIGATRDVTFMVRRGTAYIIESTASKETYDYYGPIFAAAAKSFRLIPAPENCRHQICKNGKCVVETLTDCCGNGKCEASESCSSCSVDCGVCPSRYPPLEATLINDPNWAGFYSMFNCENYLVKVRIENPLDEVMSVYSDDALRLRSLADSECRAEKGTYVDCLATMSGSFGDAYSNDTVERNLTLYAYGGTEIEKGEIIYSKSFKFNVSYRITWIGPYCMQFYCVPGYTLLYGTTRYAITGVEDYRGDVRFGNTWCHANMTRSDGGETEIYVQKFYGQLCVVNWSKYGIKQNEKCYSQKNAPSWRIVRPT